MDLEFKKTGGKLYGKLGLYAVLLLCVAAAGVGSYAAIRRSLTPSIDNTTTIDWYNQGGTVEAGVPQTGVTIVHTQPPATTTEREVTTAPDNLPFTGSFSLPLGTQILKDYSNGDMVSSKTMGDWRVHNGIDFTGVKGEEVRAIQRGTVKKVYDDPMWGVVVEIDHGNTMLARYCGLTAGTTPKAGDTVERGARIGELGTIPVEEADGYHLHIEITVDSTIVDPLAAMNRAD